MNRTSLDKFTCDELRTVADGIGCKRSGTKQDLITRILTVLNEKNSSAKSNRISQSIKTKQATAVTFTSSESPKQSNKISSSSTKEKASKKIPKFEILQQLGKGKEGTTYLVQDPKTSTRYAMKTFKKQKSISRLNVEVELQKIAATIGVAPEVHYVNDSERFFVMDKLDTHLIDIIRKNDGLLPAKYQTAILNVFRKLDKAKVFHGDANIMNYMIHKNKLYMIDYGMSKAINPALVERLGTSSPNYDIMSLGLVLKLRELGCPKESYEILLQAVSPSEQTRFNLNVD